MLFRRDTDVFVGVKGDGSINTLAVFLTPTLAFSVGREASVKMAKKRTIHEERQDRGTHGTKQKHSTTRTKNREAKKKNKEGGKEGAALSPPHTWCNCR